MISKQFNYAQNNEKGWTFELHEDHVSLYHSENQTWQKLSEEELIYVNLADIKQILHDKMVRDIDAYFQAN
jgi:hypothetical protein